MKKRIYIFTLLALTLWGCHDLDTDTLTGNTPNAQLMVSLDLPEPTAVKTRAGMKDNLQSLYLLLFDQNGLYLSKHEGVFASGTATTANYTFGSVPTSRPGEMLILHFLANYDWATFSDAAHVGKSEAEVMTKLTVTGGNVAYWQRVELPDGLDGVKGTTIALKDDVSLLRNVAKITVENLTNEPANNKHLTNVSFAVGNAPARGTVAPYSPATRQFARGAITEATDGTLIAIAGDGDFVNAQNGSAGVPSEAKLMYERKNSTARNQTYLILKAYFQNTAVGTNTTRPCYYKIDIDNDQATALLDIERNYHYILRLNDVAMEGHATLQEAIDNPASNNINAALKVAEYTSVSDGTNILQVEKTVFSFVASGQDFQIKYSYFDGIALRTDNTKVTVTLDQNASTPVIENGAFSYANGVITARTATIPANNDIYQATFTVSDGQYLARKITLRLRKPMNFVGTYVTPTGGTDPLYCKVANAVAQPVTIVFSFPPDISPAVFPLPVYIYSGKLSPDPTKEGIQPLSVDPTPNGTFRYVYMAPYLGNDANDVPKPHTVYLVTSTPASNEDVVLTSDYFNPVTIQVRSENIPALGNVKFNPNPVIKKQDEPVVLTFNIPEVADQTLPYKIRIHTDHLTFVSTTGINCVWDEAMGVYHYTTNTTGSQSITFKTTRAENNEYVRIDGDRFASITVKRTILPGEFRIAPTQISGGAPGTPVDISFSFDATGAHYAQSGITVYFTSQNLTPAPGSGIVSTGKTNEYSMTVASSAQQTARFLLNRTVNSHDGESVKLSATDFKDAYAAYTVPGKLIFGSSIPGYENRPVFTNRGGTPLTVSQQPNYGLIWLRFSIPSTLKINGNPISDANPLWVYYESSLNEQYLGYESKNIAGLWSSNTTTAAPGISYKKIWMKITTTGDKILDLGTNLANDQSVSTLMSVSSAGETTSNGIFETATGFQNK